MVTNGCASSKTKDHERKALCEKVCEFAKHLYGGEEDVTVSFIENMIMRCL